MEKAEKYIGMSYCGYNKEKLDSNKLKVKETDESLLEQTEEILKKFGKLIKRKSSSFYAENVFHLERNQLKMRIALCDRRFEIMVIKADNWDDLFGKRKAFKLSTFQDWCQIDGIEHKLSTFFRLFKRKTPKKVKEARQKKFEELSKNCSECEFYDNCCSTLKECRQLRKEEYK
jgi:hypothetical protein